MNIVTERKSRMMYTCSSWPPPITTTISTFRLSVPANASLNLFPPNHRTPRTSELMVRCRCRSRFPERRGQRKLTLVDWWGGKIIVAYPSIFGLAFLRRIVTRKKKNKVHAFSRLFAVLPCFPAKVNHRFWVSDIFRLVSSVVMRRQRTGLRNNKTNSIRLFIFITHVTGPPHRSR